MNDVIKDKNSEYEDDTFLLDGNGHGNTKTVTTSTTNSSNNHSSKDKIFKESSGNTFSRLRAVRSALPKSLAAIWQKHGVKERVSNPRSSKSHSRRRGARKSPMSIVLQRLGGNANPCTSCPRHSRIRTALVVALVAATVKMTTMTKISTIIKTMVRWWETTRRNTSHHTWRIWNMVCRQDVWQRTFQATGIFVLPPLVVAMLPHEEDNLTGTHNQILLPRDPIYDPPTKGDQASSTVDNDMTENSKMWEEQWQHDASPCSTATCLIIICHNLMPTPNTVVLRTNQKHPCKLTQQCKLHHFMHKHTHTNMQHTWYLYPKNQLSWSLTLLRLTGVRIRNSMVRFDHK